MPSVGYSTIGLKPCTMARLQEITDKFYPGMFYPSTLIIMMNEIKLGRYSVRSHKFILDLSGDYKTLTIRSDVENWLRGNYRELQRQYRKKYPVRSYAGFVNYFLENLFESKMDAQRNIIRLEESEFKWLWREYNKHENGDSVTFERFADTYINTLLYKVKTARDILSM